MSSISPASAAPYVPSASSGIVGDTTNTVAETATVASPALNFQSAALAPATATALIIQQGSGDPSIPASTHLSGLDLSGQDLTKADLTKRDLRGANLSGADLSGMNLTGLDFSGANLSGAKLVGASLTNVNLTGVNAKGADFGKATLISTTMDNGDFSGASFSGAYVGKFTIDVSDYQTMGIRFAINGAKLENADFSGATLKGVQIVHASAQGINFSGANLERFTGITSSDLSRANFQGVNGGVEIGDSKLDSADFTKINGAGVAIGGGSVKNLSFEGSSFRGLSLGELDLREVNMNVANHDLHRSAFVDVNMSGMNFSGFNFSGAIFQTYSTPADATAVARGTPRNGLAGTNFSGANFSDVRFSGMNLNEADLSGANLSNTLSTHEDASVLSNSNIVGINAVATLKNLSEILARQESDSLTALRSWMKVDAARSANVALSMLSKIATNNEEVHARDGDPSSRSSKAAAA